MADDAGADLHRAVGVTSVQAWRGTFAGDPEPDGTPFTFDAVVIEFGIDVGVLPPLFVPVDAVAGLAQVLVQAAEGPNADGADLEAALAAAGVAPGPPVAPDPDDEADPGGPDLVEVGGDEWAGLLAQPRLPVASLARTDVPGLPGVYAWFRGGRPVHLGRATGRRGLRARIGGDHLLTDADLTRSAFRRAVAEHLGLATTTGDGSVGVTPEGAAELDAWIAGCEVAWLACANAEIALDLEAALLAEHHPEV